jgi:formylglycine-generating enzyme required for sulfatase activity
MNATDQRVVIKLIDVGSRKESVQAVLSKIQGLKDTPERLVAGIPCYISGEVSLSLAEKVKNYLEKAGAVVELEDNEMPRRGRQAASPSSGVESEFPASSFSDLLTTVEDDDNPGLYEVTETDVPAEDITFFSTDSLPKTPTVDEFYDQQSSFSDVRTVDAFYDEEPVSGPRLQKRRRKKKRVNTSTFMTVTVVIIIAGIAGISIWMYFSGKFSRFMQQYEQSPVVGVVGTLEIENAEGADLKLYQVVGTRVVEQILLEGTTTHLPQGDYYVEAQKGSQTLHYPVYIEGRGHRVNITVSFPTKPVPNSMAYIPAGWFRMGNKETEIAHFGFPDEKPDIDVYVGAFLMSKYEVTNREYAQFIEDGGYEKEVYWESLIQDWNSLTTQVPAYERVYGNDGWNSVKKYIRTRFVNTDDQPGPRLWEEDIPPYEYGLDDHPVLGITLYEAEAYCQWLTQKTGKLHRLPTEAEWEKAARGYEGYFFSYGNEYDPTRANTESEGPQKIGSYPPNGYGVYDLTGNVWEWISDQYREDAYQYLSDAHKKDIRNPKVFDETNRYNRRIVRGGSFRSVNRINAKATIRYPMFPNYWHTNIGFRYVTMP